MNITILSTDVYGYSAPAGGIATFVMHLARLLRSDQHRVTIIYSGDAQIDLSAEGRAFYAMHQIDTVKVRFPQALAPVVPNDWTERMSAAVAPYLQTAEVVYTQDAANPAYHYLRARRFRAGGGPVVVTVAHGSTGWVRQTMEQFPDQPEQIIQDYIEKYAAQHSDYFVSPSRYMLDWTKRNGWKMPGPDRVCAIGLPLFPGPPAPEKPIKHTVNFREIIYFGRRETRKGYPIFIEALRRLAKTQPERLLHIEQITFLGAASLGNHGHETTEPQSDLEGLHLPIKVISNLGSPAARRYLAEHADQALVVIPSRSDNFPYTVVEASLIPDLNLLCASGGGIPEIFGGDGADQLFEPHARLLAKKIGDWLLHGPRPNRTLGHYDYLAANDRWRALNREVCAEAEGRRRKAFTAARPPFDLKPAALKPAVAEPRIDICIAAHNASEPLSGLLESLERQTRQDFTVTVIENGSTDSATAIVFEALRQKYTKLGWAFMVQTRFAPGIAGNTAAQTGKAPFILFCDSHDLLAPNALERFIAAFDQSGDAALSSYAWVLAGDPRFEPMIGLPTALPTTLQHYIGAAPVLDMLDHPLSAQTLIIRRATFEQVGGFPTPIVPGMEMHALITRLSLSPAYGFDIVPEYLIYHRTPPDDAANPQRINPMYATEMAVFQEYETLLHPHGMGFIPLAIRGTKERIAALERYIWEMEQLFPDEERSFSRTRWLIPSGSRLIRYNAALPSPPPPATNTTAVILIEPPPEPERLPLALPYPPPTKRTFYIWVQERYRSTVPLNARLRLRDLRWRVTRKPSRS